MNGWWGCKMGQLLWKTVASSSNVKQLLYDPPIPLLGQYILLDIHLREIKTVCTP